VAPALQPALMGTARHRLLVIGETEGIMFARMTVEGRLLGFDAGDWSILLSGLTLAGFIALLV
jgi:hypothetical protein